jgi:mRNA degradation ribonuclease J1/J2
LQDDLFSEIFSAVNLLDDQKKKDDAFLKEEIRLTVRHFITEHFGKKPLLEIHLTRI